MNKYIIYCRKSSESDERQIQSLSDQMNTLLPLIQQRNLQILGEPLQESKSAKCPGRPIFDHMIALVEEGLANGIMLLNPSRLSRNTVDTGRIIYLMDQKKLEEVVTPYQVFKNNPYDKFMLNLLCTQAKLENDNKSVNVTESLQHKAERGDYPGKARPGYMNNSGKSQGRRDISAHPLYFSLMRKVIDLALTGNYSVERLCRKAQEYGIQTYNGKIMGKSSLHRYLRDPFYTGKFLYKGKLYVGNHPALMTDEEFELLQKIILNKGKTKYQKHEMAFNELIKCGECQYCVTSEQHTKTYRNGTKQTFTYYRCSKKSKTIRCTQPYISKKMLEAQVSEELTKFELEPEFAAWAIEALEEVKGKDKTVSVDKYKALQQALEGVNKRLNNLLTLKISAENSDGSLLSDEDFAIKKLSLTKEKETLVQQINQLDPHNEEWVDLAKGAFNFALQASKKFSEGGEEDKKTIARTVGSNLILLYQKLQFQPRFMFLKYKEGIERTKLEISRLVPEISLENQANLNYFLKSSIWYR